MSVSRLVWDNRVLDSGVVLTASSELADRPSTYLLNRARWKKWRSDTGTGDEWVKFDFGSAQSFQVALLVDYKVHTGGSVRFQANATDSWGSPSVDEALTIPSPNDTKVIGHWFSASQSYRWARVFFSNDGAASDYAELGVCMVAPYFEPARPMLRGVRRRRIDPSLVVASLDGQESAQTRTKYFMMSGLFAIEEASDRAAFELAYESMGVSRPGVMTADPSDWDETLYGRFNMPLGTDEHRDAVAWEVPFEFQEVR